MQGAPNPPGTKKKVLIAPISAFETIEAVTDPLATDSTRVKITGDHVFKVDEGFIEMYTTLDTGQLTAEMIGERDGRGYNPNLNFFHPGTKAEAMAFADAAKDDEFIILVPLLDGSYLQVGSEGLGAEVTANFDSGTVSSGRKGYTFTATTYDKLYIYEGAVVMKPDGTGGV